jgi:hypothetical protein
VTACAIYERLLETNEFEPDVGAFREHRPYTHDLAAGRVVMGRAAVGAAVIRLIEHGFAERLRAGRSFTLKLLIPRTALIEYGQRYLDAFEPSMAGYLEHRHLAEKVLEVFTVTSKDKINA